jgi:hypothetical protein
MTNEELLELIQIQEARITALEASLLSLRQWSDANDRYLEEVVNALTDSVDKIMNVDHSEEDR